MVFPIVCASFMCLVVPILAFPVSPANDIRLNTLQKKFEIVEGPREVFLPLVPLRDTVLAQVATKQFRETTSPSVSPTSDLDYIVYGKLYLMKAIAEKNQRLIDGNTENPTFRINIPRSIDDKSTSTVSNNDGISFPAASKSLVKRPYRYKTWSKLHAINDDLTNGYQEEHAEHRKLEERSADQMPVNSTPSNTSTNSAEAATESVKADDSSNIDAEALELIQKLMPLSSPTAESSESNNDTDTDDVEIQGNIAAFNLTTDNFDIVDRFLINVPTKPNFTQCPQGQRKNHRGACKPVFVHKPSPNDGFYAGKIIAANVAQRKDPNSSSSLNRRRDEIPNLQLTTLFRSVVQLEKRLETAIKEAEKQLSTKDEHSSSTLTTNKTEEA